MQKLLQNYIDRLINTIHQTPVDKVVKVVDIILKAYTRQKKVLILGNGGSASTASHFACDLAKGTSLHGQPRLIAMSLNDNMALLTAYANDIGYESVFSEQLKTLVQKDDVFICISGSGNSPNVINAIECARELGAVTVGFLGFGGGRAAELCDEHITVQERSYGPVEDVHLFLSHAISEIIRNIFMARAADIDEFNLIARAKSDRTYINDSIIIEQ